MEITVLDFVIQMSVLCWNKVAEFLIATNNWTGVCEVIEAAIKCNAISEPSLEVFHEKCLRLDLNIFYPFLGFGFRFPRSLFHSTKPHESLHFVSGHGSTCFIASWQRKA